MNCRNCGKLARSSDSFCPNCGNRIIGETSPMSAQEYGRITAIRNEISSCRNLANFGVVLAVFSGFLGFSLRWAGEPALGMFLGVVVAIGATSYERHLTKKLETGDIS